MRRLFICFCIFLNLPLQAIPLILRADEMPPVLRITTPNRFKGIFSHAGTGQSDFRRFLKKMDVKPEHQQLLGGIPDPLRLAAPCQAVFSLMQKRFRPAYMQGEFSPQQLKEKHYKRSAAIINSNHMLLTKHFFPRNPGNQHPLFNDGFNGYVTGLRKTAWEEINYYRNSQYIDDAEKDHLARLMHLYLYSVVEMRHFEVPATDEEKENAWQMATLLHEERFTTSKVIYLLKALLIKEGFRPAGLETEEQAKAGFIEEYNRFLQVDHTEPQQHFLFDLIEPNIQQAAHAAAQQQAQVEGEEPEYEAMAVEEDNPGEEELDVVPVLAPDAHQDAVSGRLRKDARNERMDLLREAAANYHAALNAQDPEAMDLEEDGEQNPPNSPENPDAGGVYVNDTDSDSDAGSDPDNQGGGAILDEAPDLNDNDDQAMQFEEDSGDEEDSSSASVPHAYAGVAGGGEEAAAESDDNFSDEEEIKPSKSVSNQRGAILESSDDESDEEQMGSLPHAKKPSPNDSNEQLLEHGKSSEMGKIIAGILKEMACTDGGIKRVSNARLKNEVASRMRSNPDNFPINQPILEKISDKALKKHLYHIIQINVDKEAKKLYFLSKSQKEEALREARMPLSNLIKFRIKQAQKDGRYPGLKEIIKVLESEKNPMLLERMQVEKLSKITQLEKRYKLLITSADWYKRIRREYDEKSEKLQKIYESLYQSLEKKYADMRKVLSKDFMKKLKSIDEFKDFTVKNPGFKSTSQKGIALWYENRRGPISIETREELNKKIVAEIKHLKEKDAKISAADIVEIINKKFNIKKTKAAIEKIIFRSGLSKSYKNPRASQQLTGALTDIIDKIRSEKNGTIPVIGSLKKQVGKKLSLMPSILKDEWLRLTENGKNIKKANTIIASARRRLLKKKESLSAS